jgi:hypothetical protein
MMKKKKEEKDKINFTDDHKIFFNELNNIHSSFTDFTDYGYSDPNNHTLKSFNYVYPEDYESTYEDSDLTCNVEDTITFEDTMTSTSKDGNFTFTVTVTLTFTFSK